MIFGETFNRYEKRQLGALLIFAALVRILYLYLYSRQPIWGDVIVDSFYHLNWADSIAAGDVIGSQTYFRAPLYIYLLAFCRALTPDSILLPRILGSALGVISIYVTYLIARRSAVGSVGRNIGLIAGVLQALYPSVIFFEAELLVDFLFAFLLQVSVYRLLIASDNCSDKSYMLVGLMLGLASLTRPTALALIPFFALFALYSRRNSSGEFHSDFGFEKYNVRGAVMLIAASVIVISPVTLRNYLVGGDLTLIASSGGVNFFIGNNSESIPVSAALPQPYGTNWKLSDMTGLAEEYEGKSLSPSEVSASWTNRALDWILENPFQFVSNYITKLYLAISSSNYSNNKSLASVFDSNSVLKYSPLRVLTFGFNFSFILFFTVVGTWHFVKSNSRSMSLIAPGIAVLYLLIISLFFITERFRLPSLILLFPAAGVGILGFWNLMVNRFTKKADYNRENETHIVSTPGLILGALIAGLSLAAFSKPLDTSLGRAEYLQANRLLEAGNYGGAKEAFGELLRIVPNYPRASLNLGVAYFLSSEPDSARFYFERELNRSADNPEALSNLASLALTQNDTILADSFSNLAYRIRPYDLSTVCIRIRSLSGSGEPSEANHLLAEAESRFANEPSYWYEVSQFYLSVRVSDQASAIEALARGALIDPYSLTGLENSDWAFTRGGSERYLTKRIEDAALIRYQLGFFSGLSGVYDSAVVYSRAAIELDSSLSAAYVNLALGYISLGQVDSAKSVYESALSHFGEAGGVAGASDESNRNLDRLRQVIGSN